MRKNLETLVKIRFQLHNSAMVWAVTLLIMLEDDAAMLAKMGFSMVTPIDESATLVQAVKDKLSRITAKIQ